MVEQRSDEGGIMFQMVEETCQYVFLVNAMLEQ